MPNNSALTRLPLAAFLWLTMLVMAMTLTGKAQAEDRVLQLMEITGLNAQINAYPEAIKLGIQDGLNDNPEISPEQGQQLLASVDDNIVPAEILKRIKAQLSSKLANSDIDHLMSWYQSDLGLALTQAEEQASQPEAQQALLQQAESLMANSERVAMAQRIDQLVGATEMSVQIQKNTGKAVFNAIMKLASPEEAVDPAFFDAQIAMMEPQIRENIQQYITLTFVYTYQNFDLEKLGQYEKFLATPEARKFYATTTVALNKSLEKSVGNWAAAFAKAVKLPQ